MLDSTPKQAQGLSGTAAGPYSIRARFETGYRQIAVLTPRDSIRYGYELDANGRPVRPCGWQSQRGAVSLPLAAAQAAIALGLASGVASLMAWAQGLIGGVL